MSRKKIIALLSFIGIILNVIILKYNSDIFIDNAVFSINVSSDANQTYQIFYSQNNQFQENASQSYSYTGNGDAYTYNTTISTNIEYLRIDLGTDNQSIHYINDISIKYKKGIFNIDTKKLLQLLITNQISEEKLTDKGILLKTNGQDPYLILDLGKAGVKDFILGIQNKMILIKNLFICMVLDLLLFVIALLYKKLFALPIELFRNRRLIFKLAINDFKTKYAGSYLGITWAFVQPIVTVLVYWFVFQVGFRSPSVEDYPFVLWFIAGLIPWFCFSDAITGGANSFSEYSYLVKKVVFPISILPIVKILSAFIIHLFFILFLVIAFSINKYYPDIYYIQLLYYSLSMFILSLGISYMTSSILVFFKDIGQIIIIVLQVGMWMTPIMWNYHIVPEKYQIILKFNPMFYIIEGYRNTLMDKIWFWQNSNMMIYFWVVTLGLFALGALIFKRLRTHFADVL